jgi:hypothetical protein
VSLIRWRRLDLPGTDEAELASVSDGFKIDGHARFVAPEGRVDLAYWVLVGPDWATRAAAIRGSTSAGPVSLEIEVNRGSWSLNAAPMPAVAGCIDLDLGFTPATNLISIRRLDLRIGARGEIVAAWLPFPSYELQPLRQVYVRSTSHEYAYSCPDLQFHSTLTVDDRGFVRDYPPLWREFS